MQTRVTERRHARWWLGAGVFIAGAAAAAYFFDPEQGRARRLRLEERAGHVARTARRRALRELNYARHTAIGRWAHITSGVAPEPAEGSTLLDRLQSELFRDRTIPHGRLTFEVEGTTVILRGEVDTPDQMAKIEASVRRVPGVIRVQSLLHLPGTPAPNKRDALIASTNAAADERALSRLPED